MDNRLLKVLKIRELFKGDRVEEYRTMCGHKVYLIREDKENQTLYIPDDVTRFNKYLNKDGRNIRMSKNTPYITSKFRRNDFEEESNLKVIGGKNLVETEFMFSGCDFKTLDLTMFKTENVKSMKHMFSYCLISKELKLGEHFITSKVENMDNMFSGCCIVEQSCNWLDMSKVKTARDMFNASSIKFTQCDMTLEVPELEDATRMFSRYAVPEFHLQLKSTDKLKEAKEMFSHCRMDKLVLEADLRRIPHKELMFEFFSCWSNRFEKIKASQGIINLTGCKLNKKGSKARDKMFLYNKSIVITEDDQTGRKGKANG